MLRDEVIFMQRPLKSCKHLVSLCEFEKQERVMRVQQDDGKGGRQLVERKVKFGRGHPEVLTPLPALPYL